MSESEHHDLLWRLLNVDHQRIAMMAYRSVPPTRMNLRYCRYVISLTEATWRAMYWPAWAPIYQGMWHAFMGGQTKPRGESMHTTQQVWLRPRSG